MSAGGSKTASEAKLDEPISGEHALETADREEAAAPEAVAFVEHEGPTRMDYDHGGFPKFVLAVWALGMLTLVAYFIVNGIPDLSLWGIP